MAKITVHEPTTISPEVRLAMMAASISGQYPKVYKKMLPLIKQVEQDKSPECAVSLLKVIVEELS